MDLIEFSRIDQNFRRHPWELARARVLLDLLKPVLSKHTAVLDIGSGDAFIAATVAQAYPHAFVTCVDTNYSTEVVNNLNIGQKNLKLFSSLDQLQENSRFDLALMMDVLEHVEQPGKVLKEVKDRLKPGSKVFITVPAFQSLYTKHDENLGHFKRYSRRQLQQLVGANGYKVIASGYFFNSLFLVRFFQKKFRSEFDNDGLHNWKKGRAFTKLLSGAFFLEFKMSRYLSRLGIHIPGLTCYCLCRPLQS